jgi:hypothetical protein
MKANPDVLELVDELRKSKGHMVNVRVQALSHAIQYIHLLELALDDLGLPLAKPHSRSFGLGEVG